MIRLCESPSTHLSTKSNRILSGLFAEFDVKNQNDRIYPRKIYETALQDLLPKINDGRLLGECDHPNDRDEICLSNVSHVIRECKVEGNKVYGTVELLDTPSGKIAQALVEAGIPLGISSRGVGNTRRINEGEEVTDLKLITFDLVADPSFSNAVLSESAKIKLRTELDSVASTLPLNESIDDSFSIRCRINDIKDSLDKVPDVVSTLVESVGSLTQKNLSVVDKLKESSLRNKSLTKNMNKLQETYDMLSESSKILESKYNSLNENYKLEIKSLNETHANKIKSLKESHNKEVSDLNDEIVRLRKELAIEKRGLSQESTMPILEGLTTSSEIENKLNFVKRLNSRHYDVPDNLPLTEGAKVSKEHSKLSNIISRI